jgi:hypothetical protein
MPSGKAATISSAPESRQEHFGDSAFISWVDNATKPYASSVPAIIIYMYHCKSI